MAVGLLRKASLGSSGRLLVHVEPVAWPEGEPTPATEACAFQGVSLARRHHSSAHFADPPEMQIERASSASAVAFPPAPQEVRQ